MPLPTPFNPSPETTEQVLHQLASADRSLGEIALNFNTTLPALVLWMSRPEIAEQISALESAFARHQRLAALGKFPAINQALATIINEFNTNEPSSDRAERLREAESTRRACALLMRLARFTPGAARHSSRDPHNASPAPGGGGGPSPRGPEGARPQYSRAAEVETFLQQLLASAEEHDEAHSDEQQELDTSDDSPSPVVQASSLHASQPEGRNILSPGRQPGVRVGIQESPRSGRHNAPHAAHQTAAFSRDRTAAALLKRFSETNDLATARPP